ncbi:unnamed protein product [Urochloa humidicola]
MGEWAELRGGVPMAPGEAPAAGQWFASLGDEAEGGMCVRASQPSGSSCGERKRRSSGGRDAPPCGTRCGRPCRCVPGREVEDGPDVRVPPINGKKEDSEWLSRGRQGQNGLFLAPLSSVSATSVQNVIEVKASSLGGCNINLGDLLPRCPRLRKLQIDRWVFNSLTFHSPSYRLRSYICIPMCSFGVLTS